MPRKQWDHESTERLAQMLGAGEKTVKEIAYNLNRSKGSVQMKAYSMGFQSMTPLANQRRRCARVNPARYFSETKNEDSLDEGWPPVKIPLERAYLLHARRYMEAQLAEIRGAVA